jgi:hypothetical protein
MLSTPRVLDETTRPYVTTLSRDLLRIVNGCADVRVKDDGGESCEAFIMLVMDGDVQGVTEYLEAAHKQDDALSVTSDGCDCIMLAVLLGDVELLDAILRAINHAHAHMSRENPGLSKDFARAVEGANVNMRCFPPLLRLPLRVNIAGQSALHIAVIWQDAACVQLLLRCVCHAPTCTISRLSPRDIYLQAQTPWLGGWHPPAGLHGAHSLAVRRDEQVRDETSLGLATLRQRAR